MIRHTRHIYKQKFSLPNVSVYAHLEVFGQHSSRYIPGGHIYVCFHCVQVHVHLSQSSCRRFSNIQEAIHLKAGVVLCFILMCGQFTVKIKVVHHSLCTGIVLSSEWSYMCRLEGMRIGKEAKANSTLDFSMG